MEKSRLDENMQDGLKAVSDGVKGGNYLGDPVVVDQLVRDFFSVIFSERAKWHETGDTEAVQNRITEVCRSYGIVFMGESSAYVAQPWNSVHRLGAYLTATVEDAGDFASPGEAYFNFLAVQALNASMAMEDGSMTEDEVKAGMTDVVTDAVNVLLGCKAGIARG
jgi:hypothetical protein